jgi:hypothetical protein
VRERYFLDLAAARAAGDGRGTCSARLPMPKSHRKKRSFRLAVSGVDRKMGRSKPTRGAPDASGISGQVDPDAEGDLGRQDVGGDRTNIRAEPPIADLTGWGSPRLSCTITRRRPRRESFAIRRTGHMQMTPNSRLRSCSKLSVASVPDGCHPCCSPHAVTLRWGHRYVRRGVQAYATQCPRANTRRRAIRGPRYHSTLAALR